MDRFSAERLLGLPVRVQGIRIGRPVDLILDPDRRRVVGFDVHCGDEQRRFLPLAATTLGETALEIDSPLVLLEPAQLAFYTDHGSTFAALRRSGVVRGGRLVGTLEDIELAGDGTIAAVAVAAPSGTVRLPHGGDVQIGTTGRNVRAAS